MDRFFAPPPSRSELHPYAFRSSASEDTLSSSSLEGWITENEQTPIPSRSRQFLLLDPPSPVATRAPIPGAAAGLQKSIPTAFQTPIQETRPPARGDAHKETNMSNRSLALVLFSGAKARNRRGLATSDVKFDDMASYQTVVLSHHHSSARLPDSTTISDQVAGSHTSPVQPSASSTVICSTCHRNCILSSSPMADYLTSKSATNPPGLRLSCPEGHIYCIYCLRSHIPADVSLSSKKEPSAPGCYQCTRLDLPKWTIPLDVMHTVLLPQEVAKWRWMKSFEVTLDSTSASSSHIPVYLPDTHQGKKVASQILPKSDSQPVSTCGICLDHFFAVEEPLQESRTRKAGKAALPPGLTLPCPGKHKYCLGCITQYISTELEKGSEDKPVFPMRCPECAPGSWGMTDKVAERVLSTEELEAWHFRKLLDSIEKMHCPHASCSALIEIPNDGLLDATCPACQRIICVKCKVPWHTGLTCTEYKNNDTDAQLMYELAKRSGWRRCPHCRMIVERSSGCPHMSCRCGYHFCYRCGSDYVRGACRLGSECREKPDPSFVATTHSLYMNTPIILPTPSPIIRRRDPGGSPLQWQLTRNQRTRRMVSFREPLAAEPRYVLQASNFHGQLPGSPNQLGAPSLLDLYTY